MAYIVTVPRIVPCLLLMASCGSSPVAPTPPPQPPSVIGQWTGAYSVGSCLTSGAATGSGFCANIGTGGGMVFTPQQSGSNLTGTLAIGAFNVPTTGTVTTDGVVTVSGTASLAFGAVLTLQTWRATAIGNTMAGAMQFTIVTDQPIGAATVVGNFSLAR